MKFGKLLLPCLLALLATAHTAKAHDGLGGLGLAYMYGYGGVGGWGYATGAYNTNLPYFSLHPPVYYGKRYTRPYGVSPFAAGPQLRANSAYAPQEHVRRYSPSTCCGRVIHNPYMPGETMPAPVVHKPSMVSSAKAEPLVIENPYFNPSVKYTSRDAE